MTPYDLLLTGGDVIDVGGGQIGRLDVAVRDGRIAGVGSALSREAREIVDVTGRLVTPGLVDLHTHLHADATYWGIDPDPIAWCSGVTTWVDAGSAGAYAIDALGAAVARMRVRAPVLLNISAVGLTGRTGESRDLDNCDVGLAVEAVLRHRDMIRGIKVRIDAETVGGNGMQPLLRARAAAAACGVPVMAHIGLAPPAVTDVLRLLRPGDIVTHCASAIAAAGDPQIRAAVRSAYDAGVLFDIGHGSGGFAFDVLEDQLAAGIRPHTVSTDLHTRSVFGPVFDLPTTMAKLLAVGMPLTDVIAAATVHPARTLALPDGAGTLIPGSRADIAVFTVEQGSFELVDAHRQRRHARQRLINDATYVAGRRLPPRLPAPPAAWISLTDGQRHALADRERRLRALLAAPLVGADDLAEQFPRPVRSKE